MKHKSAPAMFKAPDSTDANGSGTGEFDAIVSVFGNVDSWGDVVMPGAFKATIADWKTSPNTLPVLWSHRMDDPSYNIGQVVDLDELEPNDPRIPDWVDPFVKAHGGLWVRGCLDTGADASPIARHALRLLKARRVTQFSYAYDETDARPVTVDGQEAWGLFGLKLFEVSPTQVGANQLTELVGAKRRTAERNDGPATTSGPAKPNEEPEAAKSGEEPARLSAARLLIDLASFECGV